MLRSPLVQAASIFGRYTFTEMESRLVCVSPRVIFNFTAFVISSLVPILPFLRYQAFTAAVSNILLILPLP